MSRKILILITIISYSLHASDEQNSLVSQEMRPSPTVRFSEDAHKVRSIPRYDSFMTVMLDRSDSNEEVGAVAEPVDKKLCNCKNLLLPAAASTVLGGLIGGMLYLLAIKPNQ